MIAVSYLMKRKIKKIYFEVISNTKFFYIKFFQWNCEQSRFCQTYRGTGQHRIRYNSYDGFIFRICFFLSILVVFCSLIYLIIFLVLFFCLFNQILLSFTKRILAFSLFLMVKSQKDLVEKTKQSHCPAESWLQFWISTCWQKEQDVWTNPALLL